MTDDRDRKILVQADQGTTGIAVWFDEGYFYPVCGTCKDRIIMARFDYTCTTCFKKYEGLTYELGELHIESSTVETIREAASTWLGIPECKIHVTLS